MPGVRVPSLRDHYIIKYVGPNGPTYFIINYYEKGVNLMLVPIIFRDVNFHIYKISADCKIFRNDEPMDPDEITYHSTNGYDYILLETLSGRYKLFRLEFIIYNSFHPYTQIKYEHFSIIHKDGNILNCRIDNLECCNDNERWTEIIFPSDIKRDTYLVSTYGRFFSKHSDIILSLKHHKSGYLYIQLRTIKGRNESLRAHRIVAMHFIENPNPKIYNRVNHIDGDKHNNHVSNLEWIDDSSNSNHAVLLGMIESNTISSNEVNMIVDMLLEHTMYGSPKAVYEKLNHEKYPNITLNMIKQIKSKTPMYVRKCTKYNLNLISFKNSNESRLTSSEIDMIIEMLLSDIYDTSPSKIYKALDHELYPNITRSIINHIKCKSPQYVRNDSKYDLINIKFKRTR